MKTEMKLKKKKDNKLVEATSVNFLYPYSQIYIFSLVEKFNNEKFKVMHVGHIKFMRAVRLSVYTIAQVADQQTPNVTKMQT